MGIAVVGAMVATGVIPLGRPPPDYGVPFHAAETASISAIGDELGGSWAALGALGFEDRNATTVQTSSVTSFLGANCTTTPLVGVSLPASVTVPSFGGSYALGVAPLWLVFVTDAGSGAFAVVGVLDGAAVPLAEIGGADCPLTTSHAQPLPSSTVDSPVVAAAAWSDLGKDWVEVDPALTSVALVAFGPGVAVGFGDAGVWAAVYAPCNPLEGGPSSESAFIAGFNLTEGTLEGSITYPVDCPA